ncbi:MAG: hypothetical protein KA297_08220 [Kofleriaceae bacterium]|nr:hypothetical protein [Kofleriaceae bacterium]
MDVAFLTGPARVVLLGVGLVLVALALGLARRRGRAAALLGVLAVAALGVVATEQLVVLAVRVAAPDEASFNEHRWVLLAPWGRLGLALGAGAVVAITVLAWRASRGASAGRRVALVGLRGAAAIAALVVFAQPAVELRQVARERNRIAVVIDDSRSMSLRDRTDGPDRLARVRALLDASAPTLAGWSLAHHLDYYRFSDQLAPAAATDPAGGQAVGPATLIRKALESVRARYEGHDLAGVILISDGAATGDLDDDDGAGAGRDFLRSLETRVHTVWAARPGLRDIAIARILADEFAFVRTVVRIDAVVRVVGYGARRVKVTLSADGKPLRDKWVDVPADGEATVTFEITPPRVGRFLYEVSTPAQVDEAVPSNNQRTFVIRVIRDKIRALQVAGQPSWDVRALRQMLKSNPNVDLISFFILRTQDDVSLVPQDEMSLIPFPTRELFEQELPSFDLIILQNFEYLPYGIGDHLENIRAYVEGGGGLAMLGGEQSFSSGGYDGTPVAAALPVELLPPWQRDDLIDVGPFVPTLTAAGRGHPVTALRYAADDNAAAWKALPPLEGVNLLAGAKPGATVLAVHPRLRTRTGKPMPVIVAGDYGQGRSVAITTDTLWRWGFGAAARPGDDGRHYEKLWDGAIRWLIQDPDLRNLHVDTDAVEYLPTSPVRLSFRLAGQDYQPLADGTIEAKLVRGADPSTARQVSAFKVTTGDDGAASHDLSGLEVGTYRVLASATVGGKQVSASDIFLVRDGGTELDRPSGDADSLALIAAATGGSALGPADVLPADLAFDPPRVVRVDRRTDVELWNRPSLLVVAVLLLGLEWLLRQRAGYL